MLKQSRHRNAVIAMLIIGIFLAIMVKDAQTDVIIYLTSSILIGLTWIHYMYNRREKDK